jgi:anti-sigma regulatory factor (Ser/Thr protein kinase)
MSAALLEIGAVARELGVAPSTLRSWERRYRIVVPQRGPNGQRLYDDEQVVLLRQILAQVQRGMRAGAAHLAAKAPTLLAFRCFRIECAPEAPLEARRAVDEAVVEGTYDDAFVFNLRLVASELVKNAVLYGLDRAPVELELQLYPEGVSLRVRNEGGRLRMKNLRTRRPDGGRGLEIVDALADSWSIDSGPRGTTVSVRLARAT